VDQCKKSMEELKVNDDNVTPVVAKLFEDIIAPDTSDGIGTDNMTAIWIKLFNDKLWRAHKNDSRWYKMVHDNK